MRAVARYRLRVVGRVQQRELEVDAERRAQRRIVRRPRRSAGGRARHVAGFEEDGEVVAAVALGEAEDAPLVPGPGEGAAHVAALHGVRLRGEVAQSEHGAAFARGAPADRRRPVQSVRVQSVGCGWGGRAWSEARSVLNERATEVRVGEMRGENLGENIYVESNE